MIRFPFVLTPLDELPPGSFGWFYLTDGRYQIEAGGHRLLPAPDVDYYVVRLWEDLNLLTPLVLEPVPADLEPFIASEEAQWAGNWLDFLRGDGPDAPDHPVVTAAIWHGEHWLDLGYLRQPPRLRFWRTGDDLTVDWRRHENGEAMCLSIPAADFLEAVHTLDRELVAAMQDRVSELERRGGLPGLDIDLVWLRREHEDRSHWLTRCLDRLPATDWEAVRIGARQLMDPSV